MNESVYRDWCDRHAPGIPYEKVLFYKYKNHRSPSGCAKYSPEVKKWCGFWPDGTPLMGCDEYTGMERRWYWDTEEEVLAVLREKCDTASN